MSLESNGSSFNVIVELNPQQKSVLTLHPSEQLRQEKDLVAFQTSSSTTGNTFGSTRAAFLAAMLEFSNSPQFKALTYNLEDHFEIKVTRSVNLTMPR